MPKSAPPSPHKRQKMYTGEVDRTLGAPRFHQAPGGYTTAGGMYVDCEVTEVTEPREELECPSSELLLHMSRR